MSTVAELASELDALYETEPTGPTPSDQVAAYEALQEVILASDGDHLHHNIDPELAEILATLRNHTQGNMADYFERVSYESTVGLDEEGEPIKSTHYRLQMIDVTELPREHAARIKKMKVTRKDGYDQLEFELYDVQNAIDKLMRYHGAFQRDNEQVAAGAAGAVQLLLSSIGGNGLPVLTDNQA